MQRLYGWSEQGNHNVLTNGVASQNNTAVQRSYPGATVTVYAHNSNNLATLYSDNNGTPLANPFTADNNAYWDFYAAAGRYDVQFSGNNFNSFSLPDISIGAIQSINNQTGENINIILAASGNNANISANNNNVTINLPTASANNNGLLSAADWATFNGKGANLAFTAPLVNTNNTVALTLPLTIAQGGSNANTATAAFDNLSPITTKGDLIAGNATAVAVRIPVGNNGYVLTANGAAANGLDWEQVSLSAGVTGILPVANGGSNSNTAIGAFTNLSPITTKGDLITANATNVPVRVAVGANNQVPIADATGNNGWAWGNMNLAGSGVAGILPSSKGGTGGNNNAQGFDLLSPMTANGDLITRAAGTGSRIAIGNQNDVLTVNNNNAAVWQQPAYLVAKYTVAFNNNAFVANALAVDLTLFTLGQYQKIAGVTVKPSALFLNANNTMTDVAVSLGIGGNSNLYTANYSIGNNGAVGNSNFQDTDLFKSGNMGGNTAVLAHFTAANANFGNGVATVLLSGSVDIWVTLVNLQ